VGAEAGELSTYVVSAQLVKGGHHGQQNSTPPLIPQPAGVVGGAAANTEQQQQRSGNDSLTASGKPGRSSDGRPSSSRDTGDGAVVALLPTQEAFPPPPHRRDRGLHYSLLHSPACHLAPFLPDQSCGHVVMLSKLLVMLCCCQVLPLNAAARLNAAPPP
jgi:hypothetical protein